MNKYTPSPTAINSEMMYSMKVVSKRCGLQPVASFDKGPRRGEKRQGEQHEKEIQHRHLFYMQQSDPMAFPSQVARQLFFASSPQLPARTDHDNRFRLQHVP